MIDLPIASRELLALARNRLTYRSRMTVTIVTFVWGGGFSLLFSQTRFRGAGQLLQMLATYMMIYCMVTGAQATADSISSEKRNGTIGLLFLTHLSSFDIVLGKLLASALASFYGLMASFPVLSLLMLGGGVQGREIFRLCLTALNTLFVSAAFGLLASTLSRERKRAFSLATMSVLLFWLGIPAIAELLRYQQFAPWTYLPLTSLSIWHSFQNAISAPTIFIKTYFWLPLLWTHLIGWLALATAAWFLPRRWQDIGAKSNVLTLRQRFQQWCYGKAETRARLRAHLLNRHPFLWLAARDRFKSYGPLVPAFFALCGFILILFLTESFDEPGAYVVFLGFCGLILFFLTSGSATACLAQEHEQGTLELLLCTPLTPTDIIRGQILACWRHLRFVYIGYGLCDLIFLGLIFSHKLDLSRDRFIPSLMFGFLLPPVFGLLMGAVIHLGLWGVITRKAGRSIGATFTWLLILPLLTGFFVMAAGAFISFYFSLSYNPMFELIYGGFFLLFILNALFWIRHVRRHFPCKLREFAMKRYLPEERKSLLAWIFRRGKKAHSSLPPHLVQTA